MQLKDEANAAGFESGADDVFGRIAARYDLLSDLFSLGLHRLWKQRMATLIAAEPWTHLLDAASGTGEVMLRVARRQSRLSSQRMVASDISTPMLRIARARAERQGASMDFCVLDAQSMPEVADACVDLYSISLGLKICDRRRVMREALRVLRPGGRFIALEASNIRWGWLNGLYLTYMSVCMPVIGWLATRGDASAYRYLLTGIRRFPPAEELADELRVEGFVDVVFERLSLGIVAIHSARKPVAGAA